MKLLKLILMAALPVVAVVIGVQLTAPRPAEPITLETALGSIAGVNVLEITTSEISEMVVVTFTADGSETTNHWRMTQILCAAREHVPDGYGLRLGGKLANDMTIITATADAAQIAGVECPAVIDWATWAAEYSG